MELDTIPTSLKEVKNIYDEVHESDYFVQIGVEILAGPVADAEGNSIYGQYSTRENLVNILGKRKHRSKAPAIREIISTMKQHAGVHLSLDEKRCIEA